MGGRHVWLRATTVRAFQHELGHNLGMNQAVQWRALDQPENSDFMGSGAASLNAPHILEMGWLRDDPAKVVELNSAGELTLQPLDADPRASALPMIAVVRPAAGANTYVLSCRATGPDNPLSDKFTRGLNIHITTNVPGQLNYFVTTLGDGAAYHDGPLVIRQLHHAPGSSVTFRIDFAGQGQALSAGPPPAPPGSLQSLASGKCLTVASTQPGSEVREAPCDGTAGQARGFNGTPVAYVLQNAASGLCLDIPGGSVSDGATLIAWTCHGAPNQVWRYTPRSIE